jgi:large subunit ribosomal protein L9
MKIILKKEVANLGEAGDVVEVKAGYALNYLVPQGYATIGTPAALKQHAETIRQRAHKEAKLVADAQAAAAKIEAVEVKIAAKVGESGKLYGAVTAAQVAEALAAAGVEVDKKNVTVPEIKETGEFEGKVKCYKGVFAKVKVLVEAEAAAE